MLRSLERKCDCLCRGATSGFECLLSTANHTGLIDVEVPGPNMLVEVELNGYPTLGRHASMLQEGLEFLQ